MTNQLQVEHFESTGKWDPETWQIGYTNDLARYVAESFSIEKTNDGRLSVTISLNSEHFKGKQRDLHQRVEGLLDAGGIEGFEIRPSSHPRLSSVVLKGAEVGDLTKMLGALSSDVERQNDTTFYSIVDKKLAIEMANIEEDSLGSTDLFSLNRLPLTDSGNVYVDYESDIPGAAVTTLQQDGMFTALKGQDVIAEKTNIFFEDGAQSDIINALKAANLDFTAHREVIRVNEPIHEVASALARANLIPKVASEGIAREFAEIRSEFTTVSDVALEKDRVIAARRLDMLPDAP